MQSDKYSKKTKVPTREDGQVGIRATLNNMGFSDSDIGYDEATGTVTLNGKNLMKPGYMDEDAGISYANRGDIQKSVTDFYKNSSNPVVRVSDAYAAAAGKYGLSADALSYSDNGTVSIGGQPIDILYIDDTGKSWARQNTVDTAAETYANRVGVQSPSDLAEEYAQNYLTDAYKLANQLVNRKDFSYDPDSDPVFLAYQNKYRLEGERAGRNANASYAALTGGYANSAAATAGAQASQYYAQQLSNTIPELAQQAYDRYMKKYQTDLDLLNQMVDLYDTAYQNASAANTAQRKNANASTASNIARDEAAAQRAEQDWEREWKELQNQQAYTQNNRDSYWNEVFNTQNVTKNNYTNEQLRLNNIQQQTYQQYYERLLQEELSGAQLDNALSRIRLYQTGLW